MRDEGMILTRKIITETIKEPKIVFLGFSCAFSTDSLICISSAIVTDIAKIIPNAIGMEHIKVHSGIGEKFHEFVSKLNTWKVF